MRTPSRRHRRYRPRHSPRWGRNSHIGREWSCRSSTAGRQCRRSVRTHCYPTVKYTTPFTTVGGLQRCPQCRSTALRRSWLSAVHRIVFRADIHYASPLPVRKPRHSRSCSSTACGQCSPSARAPCGPPRYTPRPFTTAGEEPTALPAVKLHFRPRCQHCRH